jgi:hypothetical protein
MPREEPARRWAPHLAPRLLPGSADVDTSCVDTTRPLTMVNFYVLHELAQRARAGLDPLLGMELVYETAFGTVDEFMASLTR